MAISRVANTTSLGRDNPTVALTYTRAFTVSSNANRLLLIDIFGDNSSDKVLTVTYGLAAMSQTEVVQVPSDRFIYTYGLLAPASGSNNLVITVSADCLIQAYATEYFGVETSGFPDSHAHGTASSASAVSAADTVVGTGAWIHGFHRENSGATDTWTGMTQMLDESQGLHVADTNGTVSAGSNTITATTGGSLNHGLVLTAFIPVGGGGGGGGIAQVSTLTIMGVQ